jgi:tRNA-binding EMAP/Myf-like protein
MNKTLKLQQFMTSTGTSLTAKQISSQFGIKNAYEAIRQMRESGVCVYANSTTLSNGTKTTKYRVGTPSKAMVAAAYALYGGEFFSR